MPVGYNDRCVQCRNGNGLYCGGNGVPGDSSTLYNCSGGSVSAVQGCSLGCQRMPAGVNDRCAPCPNGNGRYCGGNGVPGDPNTLYNCSGGSVSVVQACGVACQRMPTGVNDQCAACPYGNGLYCGGNGVPGNSSTLYNCSGGNLTVVSSCASGCQRMAPGINDQCASAGSCRNGDGLYCGSNGVPGDRNTLYRCSGGNISVVQTCSNGCQRMPAGINDQCAAGGSCPNGNGLYCGGNRVGGDPKTLYYCSGGTLSVSQNCASGCQVMPPGVNDHCVGGTSCPNGNGLYCGSNGISGNPNTLYSCSNGNVTPVQACAHGCHVMPAGANDQCSNGPSCPNGDGPYCGGHGVGGNPTNLYSCSAGNLTLTDTCTTYQYGCVPGQAGVSDQCWHPPMAPPPPPPPPPTPGPSWTNGCDPGCSIPSGATSGGCQHWGCKYISSVGASLACVDLYGNPGGYYYVTTECSGNTSATYCVGLTADYRGNGVLCPWPSQCTTTVDCGLLPGIGP